MSKNETVENQTEDAPKKAKRQGNYINGHGTITLNMLKGAAEVRKTLVRVAEKHNIKESERENTINYVMAVINPEEERSVDTLTKEVGEAKHPIGCRANAEKLLRGFMTELLYGVTYDEVQERKAAERAEKKKSSGVGRGNGKRRSAEQIINEKAAKALVAEYRAQNNLPERGKIPNDHVEACKQYVVDNLAVKISELCSSNSDVPVLEGF